MTRPRKPRNNARKKAARTVQRETGLRYKKALAQVSAPTPARRGITADGDNPMTASIGLICAQAAVDAAIKALEIPPTTNDLPSPWSPAGPARHAIRTGLLGSDGDDDGLRRRTSTARDAAAGASRQPEFDIDLEHTSGGHVVDETPCRARSKQPVGASPDRTTQGTTTAIAAVSWSTRR